MKATLNYEIILAVMYFIVKRTISSNLHDTTKKSSVFDGQFLLIFASYAGVGKNKLLAYKALTPGWPIYYKYIDNFVMALLP